MVILFDLLPHAVRENAAIIARITVSTSEIIFFIFVISFYLTMFINVILILIFTTYAARSSESIICSDELFKIVFHFLYIPYSIK